MLRLLLLMLLLTAATACSKKDAEPATDFGPNGGYTARDNNNLPAGANDPTDWTRDENWNATEQKLFANLNLSLTGPQLPTTIWETSAFPNPGSLNGGCNFAVRPYSASNPGLPSGTIHLSFCVVDAHFKPLDITADAALQTSGLTFGLRLDPAKFAANSLYRVYYVIYSPGQQVYYKGHGDIKIK